jgi:hypothetical protein
MYRDIEKKGCRISASQFVKYVKYVPCVDPWLRDLHLCFQRNASNYDSVTTEIICLVLYRILKEDARLRTIRELGIRFDGGCAVHSVWNCSNTLY